MGDAEQDPTTFNFLGGNRCTLALMKVLYFGGPEVGPRTKPVQSSMVCITI